MPLFGPISLLFRETIYRRHKSSGTVRVGHTPRTALGMILRRSEEMEKRARLRTCVGHPRSKPEQVVRLRYRWPRSSRTAYQPMRRFTELICRSIFARWKRQTRPGLWEGEKGDIGWSDQAHPPQKKERNPNSGIGDSNQVRLLVNNDGVMQ